MVSKAVKWSRILGKLTWISTVPWGIDNILAIVLDDQVIASPVPIPSTYRLVSWLMLVLVWRLVLLGLMLGLVLILALLGLLLWLLLHLRLNL